MASRPQEQQTNNQRKIAPGKGTVGAAAVAAILAAVFALEGGFVNHPNDPGGATNMGITEAVARRHGFAGNMRDLPKWMAEDIYYLDYIDRPNFMPLVLIEPAVAEEVIDTAVNMGPARPSRFFQRAVNVLCGSKLAVDGRVGPRTVEAWFHCHNRFGAKVCIDMLNNLDRQQRAEYDRLVRVNPQLQVFHRGWINHRINNVDRRRCK